MAEPPRLYKARRVVCYDCDMSSHFADYQLIRLSDQTAAADREAVIDFWLATRALPDRATAAQRVDQVAYIVRDGAGALAAISTVYLDQSVTLQRPMWFFRCFVAAGHRQRGLARLLLVATGLWLNDEYVAGRRTQAIGLQLVVENNDLETYYTGAVWSGGGRQMAYIGPDTRGRRQYVFYFDGARV